MSRHEVDMAAVQRDAATIQSLSTRSLDELDLGDPVVAALAAWVTEIDAGIDDTIAFSIGLDAGGKAVRETAKGRRAALVAGSTVLALVVSSGAAAAVTGDPLLVVKAPFRVISEVNPFDDDASNARDRLPDQAPAAADANKLLADAKRAMARGDVEEAERLLAEAKALLAGSVNPGQQNRIDKVAEDIAGTPDRGPKDKGPQDKSPQDKSPQDKSPQDKSPQDKSPKGEKAVDNDPQDNDPAKGNPTGKPTEPPGKPGETDTSTEKKSSEPAGGNQRTEDPSSTKPEKPSKATGNG